MMKNQNFFKEKTSTLARILKHLFYTEKDPKVANLIDNTNMETLHSIAVVAIVAEIISLGIFILAKGSAPSSPGFKTGVISVSFAIVLISLISLFTKKLYVNYRKTGKISHAKSTALIIVFYTILSIWGIYVDIKHYILGEQMLTFYIVQFCFLNFLMIVPKIGNFLILAMFILLYIPTVYIDNSQFLQPNNHFVFAAIAVFANVIQYARAIEKNRDKVGVSELNKTLKERSVTDDLTKLKNRYALREEFGKVFGKEIFITMADIDYFKTVNDTYGHLVGDEILQLVAKSLNEVFPRADIYRYGGDEFLIILENYSQELYDAKLLQWKDKLSQIHIPNVDMTFACSSGYSFGKPMNEEDYRSLLKEADDKLYEVKKSRGDKR